MLRMDAVVEIHFRTGFAFALGSLFAPAALVFLRIAFYCSTAFLSGRNIHCQEGVVATFSRAGGDSRANLWSNLSADFATGMSRRVNINEEFAFLIACEVGIVKHNACGD